MNIWVAQILPIKFLEILPAATLIIIGLIVEKYYVGRIAILSNAIALSTFFYKFNNLNFWLILYINILTLAGILCLVSYVFKFKLPQEFYFIAGIFSSIISGILLLYGAML